MSEKVTEQDIKNWRWHYEGIDHDQMTGCDLFVLSCLDTIEAQAATLAERDAQLAARQEREKALLEYIDNWAKAYPLDIFPEPNFVRVREVLEASGITLDCVSASNMRHVITRVAEEARRALDGEKE